MCSRLFLQELLLSNVFNEFLIQSACHCESERLGTRGLRWQFPLHNRTAEAPALPFLATTGSLEAQEGQGVQVFTAAARSPVTNILVWIALIITRALSCCCLLRVPGPDKMGHLNVR